jgi:hypothetical protein
MKEYEREPEDVEEASPRGMDPACAPILEANEKLRSVLASVGFIFVGGEWMAPFYGIQDRVEYLSIPEWIKRRKKAAVDLAVNESMVDSMRHPVPSLCGCSSQYAYSEDGGKNIQCLLCENKHLRRQRDQLQATTQKLQEACTTLNALTVIISHAIETAGVEIQPTDLEHRLANLLTVLICERDLARDANGNLESRVIAAEQRAGELEDVVRRVNEHIRATEERLGKLKGE